MGPQNFTFAPNFLQNGGFLAPIFQQKQCISTIVCHGVCQQPASALS